MSKRSAVLSEYKLFVISLCLIFIFVSCASGSRIKRKHLTGVDRISVAVNVMLTDDVQGMTDTVDIPLSKELARKLQDIISMTLSNKAYQITDQHISVARVTTNERFYLISNATDRNLKLRQLSIGQGNLFSQKLNSEQLRGLHKSLVKTKDTPPPRDLGFNSDATLVVLVDGRTRGAGKKIGAAVGNAALLTLQILVAMAGGSGGGSGFDSHDKYTMQLGLFFTSTGELFWEKQSRVNQLSEVAPEILNLISASISHK